MMDDVDEFLGRHPLQSRWLADIVGVLNDRVGHTAHVQEISKALWVNPERDISSIEQTVTRTINNFCSEAADFHRSTAFDLFKRVEPATYRLRRTLTRDDLVELEGVKFEDPDMQKTYEVFVEKAKKKEEWEGKATSQKLATFVRNMKPDSKLLGYYGTLQGHRRILDEMVDI